jgi:uncharacterized protein YlxW (UPF0749 family)
MSKPKSYTIKVLPDTDAHLVAQAARENTYPTTLLQTFINERLERFQKLAHHHNTPEESARMSSEFAKAGEISGLNAKINRLQEELQTANAALAPIQADLQAHKAAIETIIKNAQAQFPISRKQLLKNVAI